MRRISPELAGWEIALADGTSFNRGQDADTGAKLVVTRWELSAEERARVFRGEDIYLLQRADDNWETFIGIPMVGSTLLVERPAEADATGVPDFETVPTDSEGDEDPDVRKTELL